MDTNDYKNRELLLNVWMGLRLAAEPLVDLVREGMQQSCLGETS